MSASVTTHHVEEEFSLPLFAFTVVATLAVLFAGLWWAAPSVWDTQLAAPLWKAVAVFLSLSMATCFMEFFFHRYVLHLPAIPGLGRLYRQHTLHHALTRIGRGQMKDGRRIMVVENKFPILGPEQKEGSFFPWYSLAGFTLFMLPAMMLLNWLLPSYPWFVMGFITMAASLTIYEVWHAINHWTLDIWLPLMEHRVWGGFWRKIYSFHLRHHAVIECNESVSGFLGLPMADWAFGTCLMPRTIYAEGEEWHQENFVAPRPCRFIRWLDEVAQTAIQKRRRESAEKAATTPTYTRGEEIANWVTHGLGAIASVAGLTFLIFFASMRGDAWHVVSFSVFGLTLLSLYTASTLYHLSHSPRRRLFFRRLGHAAIFLVVAGTYTPFLLTHLRGPWGWTLFGTIWGLCVAGAVFQLFFSGRHRYGAPVALLATGWLIVVTLKPIVSSMPNPGLWLLAAGVVCYAGGAVFYRWQQLRYHHAFWHTAVLGGSTCHFLAVLLLVKPAI